MSQAPVRDVELTVPPGAKILVISAPVAADSAFLASARDGVQKLLRDAATRNEWPVVIVATDDVSFRWLEVEAAP